MLRLDVNKCQFTTSSEFHLSLHKEHQHKDTQHQKQPLFPCDLCGITFVHQDDLDNHILRRHGPQQDETSPPSNIPNHVLTLVLEEQIDMTQSLKELKDTFNAHLAEIRSDQESFRDIMKQLVNGNILLSSSFKQFEKAQSNIDKQVQSISTAIFSFSPSPPAITPAVSSNAGRSESTFPPRQSSSLESPETLTQNYQPSTPAHQNAPSSSTENQQPVSSLSSKRLATSKRLGSALARCYQEI